MNQVKLGIIGLGNMGSGHCNNILAGLTPELKLTAAADLRQSRRDWAKETLPDDVVLFENGDQLIESVCATPLSSQRPTTSIRALRSSHSNTGFMS